MTPALNHDQRKAQAGNARRIPVCGGMGQPAPIVDHDKFHAGCHSSRRPNCRGVTASALSFSVRSLDLDTQTAIRVRQAAGLLPEQAAALVLDTGHHVRQDIADVPEVTHLEPHSSAVRYVPKRSDGDVGSAQKSVGDYQNVDC